MVTKAEAGRLEPFHSGEVLKLSARGLQIWRREKWRRARFKVIRLLDERDLGGKQILTLERLDLPSHARQTWSPMFFERANEDD